MGGMPSGVDRGSNGAFPPGARRITGNWDLSSPLARTSECILTSSEKSVIKVRQTLKHEMDRKCN
jgi:hypothetical protein